MIIVRQIGHEINPFKFGKKVVISTISAATILILTGCSTTGGVEPMVNNSASQSANSASAAQSAQTNLPSVSAEKGKAPTVGKPSGTAPTELVKNDIFVGSGKTAQANSNVTAHYVLMSWKSGEVLQSSWDGGQAPTFPLSGVIQGWQLGIPGMKEGGRRLLVIPPALGYGEQGSGPIAPNETLIFVVDLVKVS